MTIKVLMKSLREKISFDHILLTGAVITLAVSLFLLLGDGYFFSSIDDKSLKPVGQFTSSNNDVRRRVNNGLTWMPINNQERVYEGDSIFTGDKSEALIELDKGGNLSVDPNSLIVVRTSDSEVQIDLKYGSLVGQVKTDKKIVITEQGKKVQEISGAKGSELRITKPVKGKQTQIQVLSGEVQVKQSGKGEAKTLKKNEMAEIDEAGGVKTKKTYPIELLEPSQNALFWKKPDEATRFVWKSEEPNARFNLQVATDSRFRKKVLDRELTEQQVSTTSLGDESGTFYWQVQTLADEKSRAKSPLRKLTVYADIPPIPTFPKPNQTFQLNAKTKQQKVVLSWKDKSGSQEFQVQVASDANFTSPLIDKKLEITSLQTTPLDAGTYYWRVQGRHPARQSAPWSETQKFDVFDRPRPLLPPDPQPLTYTYIFPPEMVKLNQANFNASKKGLSPKDFPSLAWTPIDGGTKFQLEMAANETFSAAKTLQISGKTDHRYVPIKPGTIYWRVRTYNIENVLGEPSSVAKWDIQVPAPITKKVAPIKQEFREQEAYDKAFATAKLEWSQWTFATGYELHWAIDEEFKEVKKGLIKGSSKEVKMIKGRTYYWRVRAIGEGNRPISAFSPIEKVEYEKILKLPTLAEIQAEQKKKADEARALEEKKKAEEMAALKKKQEEERIAAEKQRAEEAKLQALKLEQEKIAAEKEAQRLAAAIPNKGFKTPSRAPASKPAKFLGIEGPALKEPRADTKVYSFGNAPVFLSFKWKPIREAINYEIQLSRTPDFSQPFAGTKTAGTSIFFEENVPQGEVYWRVRGETMEGVSNWSTTNKLNVNFKAARSPASKIKNKIQGKR